MGTHIKLLSTTKGLNNKIAPEHMTLGENGFEYMTEAVNVYVDDSFKTHRRNGYNGTSITTECHSLFSNGHTAVYVSGDALCIINPNTYETTPIRQVTPGAIMSYIDAPPGRIIYSNGFEKGIIEDGESKEWVMADVVVKAGQTPQDPPTGHLLEQFGGYVFVACIQDGKSVVYHSMPFSPHSFDFGKGFYEYPEPTTLMASVDDGIYIGTERDLYYLQGTSPKDFFQYKKTGIAPLKNSQVKANGKDLGLDTSSNCVIFATNEGLFGGFSGGEVVQLTEDTIRLEDRYRFADAYIKDGKYIVSFKK